jgi:hypothetical protein
LHTENNHLCQVITTFTTGLTALNGLTTQVQFFAVGTSGTDFNIASATDTHTFNLPTASATRRGALSSGDWSTFNAKMPAITFNSPLFIASGGEVGISQAGTSSNGFLSSTDWNTFNSKQNALTNPVTGTGTAGQVAYFTGTSAISGESNLFWDATNDRLSIGTATANSRLTVNGVDNTTIFSILAGGNSRLHVGTNASSQIFVRSQNSLSLNLGVDTTNYLTILSSGNVGINTATPATAFEVNGVGLFSGTSLAGNTKNGVYIYDQAIISLAGGNSRPLQIQSQTLSIFTGTTYTEKVRIFENGNVVISTSPTDAGFRIDVNGTGRFSGDITISKSTAPSVFLTNSSAINYRLLSADDGTFRIQRTGILDLLTMTSTGAATFSNQITSGSWINTPNTFGLTIRNAANTAFRTAVQMNSSNVLIFGQDTDITALTFGVGSEQMRITSSGNVGIGTTAPAERLAVVGAIMSTGGITGHGANRTTISQEGGGGAFWQSYGANTSTMGAFVFRQASSDFSVTNIPLSITAGGNVLIGSTTDIGYKLYVNGQSYLDGYNIASSFQFIRAATNTVNPASGNGILVFNSGNAQLRMNLSNAINFDMNNGGTPHIALQIRQNGNTVRVNSPDNGLALALAFQNTEYGYLGSTSAFSGSLLAYSVNGGYVYLSSSSTWISASDKNRKKNFENYNKGLAEICALKPTLFNLKTQNDNEPKIAGLIAQEVGEHLKEAYSDGEFVGIDYNVLTVTIINAIKELKQEIDTLKN